MTWDYYDDPRPDIQVLVAPAGRSVLDVGCASGALGAALKDQGARHVSGVESSREAASRARHRLDRVVEGDILNVPLPFDPAEFDYIVFADVLEHLIDPQAALRRYLPFLTANGRVVISVPNMRFYTVLLRLLVDRWSYTDSGVRDRTHLRIFTRHSLLVLIADVGLTVEQFHRNYRLIEDQSRIGRLGVLATRVVRATLAPWLFSDLLAFQYLVSARREQGRS